MNVDRLSMGKIILLVDIQPNEIECINYLHSIRATKKNTLYKVPIANTFKLPQFAGSLVHNAIKRRTNFCVGNTKSSIADTIKMATKRGSEEQ